MSLFICSNCNCIENSGASNYFIRKLEGDLPLCSECDPEIGEWHNLFPKVQAVSNEAHETTIKRAFKTKTMRIIEEGYAALGIEMLD